MTTQPLRRWVEAGALRPQRTSRREIADLLAVVDRDMSDALATGVSLDRRFAIAYSAVLGLASMVLAASGYRAAARRGHHAVTLQALPEIMGDDVREAATYFDSCRVLRNASDYDRAGVVSASEVEELLREATAFRGRVLAWLRETHPRLV